MTIHRLGLIWVLFGCATALPFLAAPSAVAATVEVVRLDGSGSLAMTAGDLVTPEASLTLPSSASSTVVVPGASSSLTIGPIFAEVDFYSDFLESIRMNTDEMGLMLSGDQSGSGLGGRSPLSAGSAFPSSAALATGTLDGSANQGGTGTIDGTAPGASVISVDGTVPGTSVITIDGTLTGPSPVPIPGVVPLFATGMAVLAGLLRRRRKRR